MSNYKKAVLLLLLPILFSCATAPSLKDLESGTETAVPLPEALAPPADYVTIVAVGDNLYHTVMIQAGEQGDYEPAYQ